jgi:hypothetical protein
MNSAPETLENRLKPVLIFSQGIYPLAGFTLIADR